MPTKRYDDEDDWDEHGILKDGRQLRVPMWAMDGLQRTIAADTAMRVPLRFADGSSDPVGSRPGFIIAEGNGRAVIDAAYRESVRELQLAWRKPGADAVRAPDRPQKTTGLPDRPAISAPARPGLPVRFEIARLLSTSLYPHLRPTIRSPAATLP
jgi:hypothetical protein